MRATSLDNTNEPISSIGFGAMPLSIQRRPAEDVGGRVLHTAIDEGMTFIDTADAYCLDDGDTGHNERLIASVIRERPDRDRIRVATKGGVIRPRGAWEVEGSPKHIREACERSLRALGVEQIFLYQFHAPDPKVRFEKSVETFADLQRRGKCRYVGLSNVSIDQIERARLMVDVVSVQNRLNVYSRDSLDVVSYCEREGITFIAYSPVGGTRGSKKIPRFELLQELADKYSASPHAIALAWVRAKGRTVVPIPGARTAEHAIDSARSIEISLAAEDVAAIDRKEFSRF